MSLALGAIFPSKQLQNDGSSVKFAVSNMNVKTVEGSFGGMRGTLRFDPNNWTGQFLMFALI